MLAKCCSRHAISAALLVVVFLLLTPISCSSTNQLQETEQCYETCHGFGQWIYGRGWVIPPYETEDIGLCLERSSGVGQGDIAEKTLRSIYDAVIEADIGPFDINDNTTPQEIIARGLNAANEGLAVPNSEGMYFCVVNNEDKKDVFYWVPNCNILAEGASGHSALCEGLTEFEASVGGLGYFVDDTLDKLFVRYVYNTTHAMKTDVQPIVTGGFSCSGRPWYTQGMQCSDPAKVLCPGYFEGTSGLGTFQVYGDKAQGVVVSQDIATWQLCQCLEDLSCDDSSSGSLRASHIILGCSLAVSIVVGSGIAS